jgi:hypothetical protein
MASRAPPPSLDERSKSQQDERQHQILHMWRGDNVLRNEALVGDGRNGTNREKFRSAGRSARVCAQNISFPAGGRSPCPVKSSDGWNVIAGMYVRMEHQGFSFERTFRQMDQLPVKQHACSSPLFMPGKHRNEQGNPAYADEAQGSETRENASPSVMLER